MNTELLDGPAGKGRQSTATRDHSWSGMRHRMFHRAVTIERRRIDRDRVVTNTKTALESLVREWPLSECPHKERAMLACLAVIRGEKPPAFARKAFVAAAQAARILRDQ